FWVKGENGGCGPLMHQGMRAALDLMGRRWGSDTCLDGDRPMTRSSIIKTALLAGGAGLWVTGLCQAQTDASRRTEQELAAHKVIAKAHLKGELLDGYNKALTQGSSTALVGADRIQADAQAAAQCNAFLEKTVPHLQKWSLELRREYRRLQSENRA